MATLLRNRRQLEHRLQGDSEIEVGDGLHGNPHVVVGASIHCGNRVVTVVPYPMTLDLGLHMTCGRFEVMDVVIEHSVRGNFHSLALGGSGIHSVSGASGLTAGASRRR